MTEALEFVERHGASVVFGIIFLDQLGIPIPTIPILFALGALAGTGRIDAVSSLLLGVIACLCADFVWFLLGRWRGSRILGGLCRFSLTPDSCVSKTHHLFARHGVKSLLVAKFIPGFDTVAPPLAGLLGVGAVPFGLWSAGGALLWLGTYGSLGYLFSHRLEELAVAASRFQGLLGVLFVGGLVAYLAWRYLGRQRVLRSIRMARISPAELYELIMSGRAPIIIDTRGRSALDALPFVIEGARHVTLEEIDSRPPEISPGSEVVVYCSCPNEVSSARAALKLKQIGILQVRPLTGGIEAWRDLRLPLVPTDRPAVG